MFNGWKITNILDVGLCELDTADGLLADTRQILFAVLIDQDHEIQT